MALKFAMILEAVDRMSGPARRATAGARQLARSARELAREGTPAARAVDRVSSATDRLRARAAAALTRVRALAGRAGMKALEKAAYGAGTAIGWTIRKVATLSLGLAKLAATGALVGVSALGAGAIATAAKFEQFQIMLEGTEGSAAKAKAAMDWVRQFAKTTPYELEQVMQAFVQLKAYGIDPLDGSLVAAGDAAAGMSKDLMQAVEALADAQTGEFERLKEFGIRARVEGNKVAFTYMKNGKEIRRETTNNAAAMKGAITGIWSDRFGGSMERQSKTFNGMISNLKDGWSDFMLRVGQAGVFDTVKGKLQGVLDWLNARLDDGSIDKWAQAVSDQMERVVKAIGKIDQADVDDFIAQLKTVATSVTDIVKGLGQLLGWLNKIDKAWGSFDAGVDKAADRWGLGGSGWGQFFRGETPLFDRGLPQSELDKRTAPTKAPARPKSFRGPATPIPSRMTPVNPRATPINLRGTPISARSTPAAPQKVAVGGKLEVELKAPPGWSAVPTRMTSVNPGVPVAYRGRANGGFG